MSDTHARDAAAAGGPPVEPVVDLKVGDIGPPDVGLGVASLPAVVDELDRIRELSPGRRTLRRFVSHRLAVVGAVILGLMALAAIFAPVVAPYDPLAINLQHLNTPPSMQNLFGTDNVGRDVLSRIIHGARVSLSVGIVAVSIYL